MTEKIVLPQFSRNVRVLGRGRDGGDETAGSSRTAQSGPFGVRREFAGLLQPGLATGQWPPPTLAHLALSDLLADALGASSPGDASAAGRKQVDLTTAGDANNGDGSGGGAEDGETEPRVREVIERTAAGGDATAEGGPTDGGLTTGNPASEPGTAESVEMATRDWQPPERVAGPDATGASTAVDSPGRDSDPASGREEARSGGAPTGDRTATDEMTASPGTDRSAAQPAGMEPAATVAPRTVLRTVGLAIDSQGNEKPTTVPSASEDGAPSGEAPSPGQPTTVTRPRTVLRQTDATGQDTGRATSGVDTDGPASDPSASGPSHPGTIRSGVGSATGGPTSDPPPLSLTVADVAPEPGSLATMGGDAAPAGGGSASTGLETTGQSTTGPSMTVREGQSASGEPVAGPGDSGSLAPGDGSTASSPQTGGAGDAPGTPGSGDGQGTIDALADAADAASTAGASDTVERVIERAIDRPRVVDRLYDAIERRRRIEDERRGRR